MSATRSFLLLAAPLVLATGAVAQQTWVFDETTTGQDIHWTSPTSVSPTSPGYDATYDLDLVEVKVKWTIFTLGPFDITDQIPPEVATGGGNISGPAPILLFSGNVTYPEPPEPTSVAADLAMGLNAGGSGYFDGTGIVLGNITVDAPPFGTITAKIVSVRIKGSLTIDETPWVNLGLALAGETGEPTLAGTGDLVALQPMSIELGNARPSAALSFIVGFTEADLPFKGGILVPSVDLIVSGLLTDPTGSLSLGATWPTGIPPGFEIYLQGWIADPAAVKGFAATNGLRGTAQ